MDYLLHSILHILVGLCIGYFFLSKDVESNRDQIFVLTISGIASIAPDITKFFGDLYGHSIWFVPVFGLLMALVSRWFFKKIDWVKLWIVFSVVIFIGHLLIDFIGNGLALYYPSTMKEFRFHIIRSVDYFILTLLFITITLSFFLRKKRLVIGMGLSILLIYLGLLSYSKVQLEQTLEKTYNDENIQLLITYPSFDNRWAFQIRTDERSIFGYSALFSQDIEIYRETRNE